MIQRFNVCDLNAIETRVGAWLAGCDSLLEVFHPYTDPKGIFHRNGRDSYLAFASKVFGLPYELLFLSKEGDNGKEAKGDAKRKRQFGKVGVLGAIYRMGGGAWGNGKASYIDFESGKKVYDRIRTGLWGFAYGQGVEITQEEAHMVVRVFREAYPEICGNGFSGQMEGIWVQLENAVLDVMDPARSITKRTIGPNGCVVIDKLNITGRHPMMRMTLPSGRRLHYFDARIESLRMPWLDKEGGDVYRPGLVYASEDERGNWSHTTTHGGKLFENLVQGIARDVLACKLIDFEEHDMPVVGHIHDEGICLVANDPFSFGLPEMVDLMSEQISWAPGLLLGADGFEDAFYRK